MLKKTVIIIEDEIVIARDIERILLKNNYEVIGIALTGKEAVKMILQREPDIVIIDILLDNGIDGYEVIRRIQEFPLKTNFVIITCFPKDTHEEINGLKLKGYIVKSFTNSLLEDCLTMIK